MAIKSVLRVKNGSWINPAGEEKTSYVTIGHIHDGKYGNDFITLEAHINLAAFPRKEGDSRIMVSVFDYEPKSFKGDNNDVPF